MNVTNFGNVPDQPTLHNHTQDGAGWDEQAGLNALENWQIRYAILENFESEFPTEVLCGIQETLSDPIPSEPCYKSAAEVLTLPMMEAYTTLNIVVIIEIHPEAALANREIGIKVLSSHGSKEAGGDHDETPIWDDSCTIDMNGDGLPDNYRPNCDTNEQVIELRLRAPDLEVMTARAEVLKGDVGDMLSVNVQIRNIGNAHATDVNIVLCAGQTEKNIEDDGCKEENIVYRQVIEAIMPNLDDEDPPTITLLYMVEAGTHDVVVVVDPDNIIVETNEDNNVMAVEDGRMGSNLGFLDVGVEVIVQYSVPGIIVLATFALFGIVGVVMYGRRMEALQRYREKSSLMANMSDDDLRF